MGRTLRSPAYQTLLDELRAARAAAGLTQQAVADALGYPQSYIAKIEGGERRVDAVELLALLSVLNADWKRLLSKVEKVRASAS